MQPTDSRRSSRRRPTAAGSARTRAPARSRCRTTCSSALDASPAAAAFFATLDGANRYAMLYRVGDCKKPETRARRIETFVAMLARGEKLHP